MIEFVKGKIVERNPAFVVVETGGGIGYRLNISLNCYDKLQGVEECSLVTQLIIKDDAHELYGFINYAEKELFTMLRGVTKIGPNSARVILSSFKPEELKKAILNNDATLISSVKGIGPKTAQRIVVELKDTIQKEEDNVTAFEQDDTRADIQKESVTALVALGFSKNPVEKVVAGLISKDGHSSVEEIVKEALKRL